MSGKEPPAILKKAALGLAVTLLGAGLSFAASSPPIYLTAMALTGGGLAVSAILFIWYLKGQWKARTGEGDPD